MDEESWVVADPLPDDVFTPEPESLWSTVLRRQGREFSMLALMPDDPSLN